MLNKFHVPHFRLTRKDLCIPYGLFMILFVVFPLLLIFYYAFTSRETGQFTFENYKAFCRKYFPAQSVEVIENNWKLIQSLPKGTQIRLPNIEGCAIGSFEVC